MPPDEEMVDLIDQEFLKEQIDGLKADLAYYWLRQRESAAYFAQNGARFPEPSMKIMWFICGMRDSVWIFN
jgi:hypothetical protein